MGQERGVYFHDYGRLALGHHFVWATHTRVDVDGILDRADGAARDLIRGLRGGNRR